MSKTETKGSDIGSIFRKLEVTLEEYLGKKAPQLPESWREIAVKLAPYLVIVSVLFGGLGFLALLGLGTFLVPLGTIGGMMTGRPFLSFGFVLNTIFLGAMVLLEGLAIPGLFSRSKKAWNFLYWSVLVGAVQNIASLNIGGLVIGGLLSMYFLFQVKEYYK